MITNLFKSYALTVAVDGSENGHIHCFKGNQPCDAGLERLKVVQQAMSNSRKKNPLDGITESDVEDAAPDSLIIDVSDIEVIDIEKINPWTQMKNYFKSNWTFNNLLLVQFLLLLVILIFIKALF